MSRGFRAGESRSSRPVEGVDQATGGLTPVGKPFSFKEVKAAEKQFDQKTSRIADATTRGAIQNEFETKGGAMSGVLTKAEAGTFTSSELGKLAEAIRAGQRDYEKNGKPFDGDDAEQSELASLERNLKVREYAEDAIEEIYKARMTAPEQAAFDAIKAAGKGIVVTSFGNKKISLTDNEWRPVYDFADGVPPMEAKGAFETILSDAKKGAYGSFAARQLDLLDEGAKQELGTLVNRIERAMNSYARFDQAYNRLSDRGSINLGPGDRENPPDEYDSETMLNDSGKVAGNIEKAGERITKDAVTAFLRRFY